MNRPGEHDSTSTDIQVRKPTDIEVMQETLMSFKVPVKMQPSPAKVQIDYNNKDGRRDLKIYSSTVHKEPKDG